MVLDCEGVHAAWKFIHLRCRAMKFKMTNALMKIRSYMNWFGSLPPYDQLHRLFVEVDAARAAIVRAVERDATVVNGLKGDWPYKERFNLRGIDVPLVRGAAGAVPAAISTLETSWGNYVRCLFVPHFMYRFSTLDGDGPKRFLFRRRTRASLGKTHPWRISFRDARSRSCGTKSHLTT